MRSATGLADHGAAVVMFIQSVSEMPGERLEHEMSALAGHLAAATARFLALVGEYDARKAWQDWECLSCAHWLSFRCGVGLHAAREQVRVARCLRELPLIAEAFARGELSYSKVRAITRAANEASQAAWIGLARAATASILDTAVARFRRWGGTTLDESLLDGDEEASERRRSLQWYHDENGDLVVKLRIPATDKEQFMRSVESAMVTEAADGERLDPFEVRRLDALLDRVAAGATVDESLAEPPRVTVHLTVPVEPSGQPNAQPSVQPVEPSAQPSAQPSGQPGGQASPSRKAPTAARSGSAHPESDQDHVAAQVSRQVLGNLAAQRWPIADGRNEVRSMSWLLGLLDEASVQFVLDVLDSESAELLTSLDLGRSARLPNRALRRSVLRRDGGGCRFPGCTRRHRLNIHHIVFWEHGGRTDAENLITLCPAHHAAIHRRGWSIAGTASTATFVRPDGRAVGENPPTPIGSLASLVDQHDRFGLDIAADGAGSLWAGDSIDWGCFFDAFASGPLAARPPVWDEVGRSQAEECPARAVG